MTVLSRTGRQLAVMDAIGSAGPPYIDDVKRRGGLPTVDFDGAVRDLLDAGVIRRFSAPLGELLYPTLRSEA
jgi:hypothetical protein